MEKLKWTDTEPLKRWVHAGIECAVLPAPVTNSANGYVRLPEGHVFRSFAHYDAIPVNVHGGLTFGHILDREGRGGEDVDWWVGFDTAHYQDIIFDYEAVERGEPESLLISHWTVDEVIAETEHLAEQVAAAQTVFEAYEVSGQENSSD